MRRTLGLFTMALMLHLVMVGSDFACAKHVAAFGAAMAGMPDHPSGQHRTTSHSEGTGDCHTPVTPDCCSAITSCTSTIIPASADVSQAVVREHQAVTPGARDLWISRVVAPETPPPRA
jgi:hypothetical protein